LTHYLNACYKTSHVCEITHRCIAADTVNVGPRSKILYGSLITRILSGSALCSRVLFLIKISCLLQSNIWTQQFGLLLTVVWYYQTSYSLLIVLFAYYYAF